ncbi:SufD family Fe-S cluster assembly protein [bacterium]|nr:SufD family Fe-S cluster assembly protein [bacterium]
MSDRRSDWAGLIHQASVAMTQPPNVSEEWKYCDIAMWAPFIQSNQSDLPKFMADPSVAISVLEMGDSPFDSELFRWDDFCDTPSALAALSTIKRWSLVTGNGAVQVALAENAMNGVGCFVQVKPGQTLNVSVDLRGSNSSAVCVCQVEQGATLTIDEIRGDDGVTQSSVWAVLQHETSRLHFAAIDFPSHSLVRSIVVRQVGNEASTQISNLIMGANQSRNYSHSRVEHIAESGRSTQLIKTLLTDESLSDFKGTVVVAPRAQLTDSVQSNQNMILSDSARALSRPQLSIFADNVKCAHGATMSQLDPDTIFYLQSRGLSSAEARSTLMSGFADEIIDQLSSKSFRSIARDRVLEYFLRLKS